MSGCVGVKLHALYVQYYSSRLNHSKLNVEVSTHTTKPQNKADHDYDLPTSFIIMYKCMCIFA